MAFTFGVVLAMLPADHPPVRAEEPKSLPPAAETSEVVINYCLNISDKAAEARAAFQAAALKDMEERVKAKISELDLRRGELETWVKQQKALQQAAELSLVNIYAAMDPEMAAKQMTQLDPRLASSVLHQLKPRLASGILNEMKPDEAAKLVRFLAAAVEQEKPAK
jgi:flagellar motility protein MotE (MotC chaperone)